MQDSDVAHHDESTAALAKGFAAEMCCECENYTLAATGTPNILRCTTCKNQQESAAACEMLQQMLAARVEDERFAEEMQILCPIVTDEMLLAASGKIR